VKLLYLVPLLLALGACGGSTVKEQTPDTTEPAASASYEDAHAAAVKAIEHSAERGHAWSTSDALLEQAVAAAADGDEKLAIQLADSARMQAELAVQQADTEEKIWMERVLSD
jgi:hypothetical protein